MAGWPGNYQTYNQPQNYQGHCPPNMVHQVTQSLGMASLSHPSDPLEYAAQGHGMLTYPVRGPELDGEDFRQFWNAAHKNKNCTGMRLPPGEYHIKPPDNCEYHHLHMACKEDGDDRTSPFVMDLSNTFLWLTARNHGGIQIDKGENVTLQGPFALCHTKEAWPFGQATLVSHSDDKLEWIVHGHDGYPNDRVFLRDNCSLNATVFDPYTRLMKGPDKHDLRTTKLEKTGDNQYKLTLPDPQDNEMNPGDYFTARSGDGSSTLSLGDCIRCSVIGATIHTSSCFGYFDGSGTANEYRDCFIMPYPRPIGNDGQLPLWSTNADGMHATDNAQGPRMLNCYFGGLGAGFKLLLCRTAYVPVGLPTTSAIHPPACHTMDPCLNQCAGSAFYKYMWNLKAIHTTDGAKTPFDILAWQL